MLEDEEETPGRFVLLPPEVIAQEIVQDLQAALNEFAAIAEALGGEVPPDVTEDAPVD